MIKRREESLMQWLVNFIQKHRKRSIENIANRTGVSRSTLITYLSQDIDNEKIGRDYKEVLIELLKYAHEIAPEEIKKQLSTNNELIKKEQFKKDFLFINLKTYTNIQNLISKTNTKYKIIFISNYFTAVSFNIIEISKNIIYFLDKEKTKNKISLDGTSNSKISLDQTVANIVKFNNLDNNDIDYHFNNNNFLDGIYLGSTSDNQVISGKVRIIPEEKYSNQSELTALLNKEGQTPFINSKQTDDYDTTHEGCYTNFYYIPRKLKGNDQIGINKYLLYKGKVYGLAYRGKLTFYVGSYYEYDKKLWIETFHSNSSFKLSPNNKNPKFALKAILEIPETLTSPIYTGNFLGYSTTDFSISGFDFFYRHSKINSQETIIENELEIFNLLKKDFEPTTLNLKKIDKTSISEELPNNIIAFRNNIDLLRNNDNFKFYTDNIYNSQEKLNPFVELKGFNNFLTMFFTDIISILDN